MTEEITGVHFKGGSIERVRLKNGQLLQRLLMLKQMERGTVFMTLPALGHEPQKVQLVKKGSKDILTTNPREESDYLEGVPTL
jgi:hypothetical protein